MCPQCGLSIAKVEGRLLELLVRRPLTCPQCQSMLRMEVRPFREERIARWHAGVFGVAALAWIAARLGWVDRRFFWVVHDVGTILIIGYFVWAAVFLVQVMLLAPSVVRFEVVRGPAPRSG